MAGLAEWAQRWGIPAAAVDDLCRSCVYTPEVVEDAKSEARVQSEVRLEAARAGVYLFRNNVGALLNDRGQYVRYGLGNDSSKVNEHLKSADLVGVRKKLILPQDVGRYVGEFVSRECKASDWKWSGTEHEIAQARWAALINGQGGDAQIVSGVGSIKPAT